MEQELAEGKEVWVKFPYGEFIIHDNRGAVLFAGGTGITAFSAYIDQLEPDQENAIDLFYGARSYDLLIYKRMIDQQCEICPKLNVWYYFENGHPQGDHDTKGILSVSSAFDHLMNPSEKNFYLSGPPQMLNSLHSDLS